MLNDSYIWEKFNQSIGDYADQVLEDPAYSMIVKTCFAGNREGNREVD